MRNFLLLATVVGLIHGSVETEAAYCNATSGGVWTDCDVSGMRMRLDTDWSCVAGINVPIRINVNNDVECLSLDGKDCLWRNSKTDCQDLLTKSNYPFRCTQADFGDPTSWCGKTYTIIKDAYGINMVDESFTLRTLSCGPMLAKVMGITGYDTPGHWCNNGRSQLKQAPPQYCECVCDKTTLSQGTWSSCDATSRRHRTDTADQWRCFPGFGVPVRFNQNNDVECMSMNGRDCIWTSSCQSVLDTHPGLLNPLSCGAMYKATYGIDGYSSPGTWCSVGLTLLKAYPRPQKCTCLCDPFDTTTSFGACDANALRRRMDGNDQWRCYPGIDVPIRMNQNNDVECMSQNGKDCMWSASCTDLLVPQTMNLMPLSCGMMHYKVYGGAGYDTPGHWCANGLAMMTKLPSAESCTCPWVTPFVPYMGPVYTNTTSMATSDPYAKTATATSDPYAKTATATSDPYAKTMTTTTTTTKTP